MTIKKQLLNLLPESMQVPVYYYYSKYFGYREKELDYLKEIISTKKRAIDIGANMGVYAYALSNIFDVVESFEPQPNCVRKIEAFAKSFNKNINVYNVGLSDTVGNLELYLPIINKSTVTGYASFNKLDGPCESILVPVKTLDDYNFTNVSLIKVDVEGYENKVITGGTATILREKPVIIIEIEQRHLNGESINSIFNQIIELGYSGEFLLNNEFIPLSEFSYEKYQEPYLENIFTSNYINNFIFKPVI